MKIYLVGGAVRDKLLGIPSKEKDWVVVNATPNEMLELGFRPVGKDFPVFLHPITHEEYALARTERKTGKGYKGFAFNTSTEVTLEEDLARRDLTINAMAETPDGNIIDPFQGRKDLENKILRHVSHAFIEDPVRILRLARFLARYASLGFRVSPDTLSLMQAMVQNGEVKALIAERVWKEWERALSEKNPEEFFYLLNSVQALTVLFPEITIHSKGMKNLIEACRKTGDPIIRFATLLHDLPPNQIKKLCDRYRIPKEYKELSLLVSSYGEACRNQDYLSASEIADLLLNLDAFRRENRFLKFLNVCEIILGKAVSQKLLKFYSHAKAVDVKKLVESGQQGKALAEQIKKERILAIEKVKNAGNNSSA